MLVPARIVVVLQRGPPKLKELAQRELGPLSLAILAARQIVCPSSYSSSSWHLFYFSTAVLFKAIVIMSSVIKI